MGKAEKWTHTKVISEVKLTGLCERLDKGNRNGEKLRVIIHIVCLLFTKHFLFLSLSLDTMEKMTIVITLNFTEE